MRTIRTRFLGYTNTLPSRIKADDGCGHSLTLSTSQLEGTTDEKHLFVARELCRQMGWNYDFASGWMGSDNYHVLVEKEGRNISKYE